MSFFENVFQKRPKINFETFCRDVSDRIDSFILERESSGGTAFIGGSCRFEVIEKSRKCAATAELYFLNDKDEWDKISMSRSLPISRFSDESVKTDIAELIEKHGIEAEIIHP